MAEATAAEQPAKAESDASTSQSESAAEVVTNAQVEQIAEQPAGKAPAANEVRELSVEPVLETRPMLPADAPAWVGAPNETSERIHRLYVASFTADTPESLERDEMLDEPMVAAVKRYLDETVFPGEDAWDLPLSPEFVRTYLLDTTTSYVAPMTTQSGIVYQKWVVLKVTPEARAVFAKQLREHKQRERMAFLGIGLLGLLGLTGLANIGFNRRRQRYPSAVTPVTMAIMPANGRDDAVQYVAAGVVPPVVMAQKPHKKRSFFGKALVMLGSAILVLAIVAPVFVIKGQRIRHRTDHTRINIDGKVWEIKTTRPLAEALSDHH